MKIVPYMEENGVGVEFVLPSSGSSTSLTEVLKDDYCVSQSINIDNYKYYHSRYINLNIDYPRSVSNVIRSIVSDDKIRLPVGIVVCNLLGLKDRYTLAYSREKNTLPSQYNKRKLSSRKLISAVDWLVKNGYVEEQRGKRNVVEELRTSSKIWPTNKLLSIFNKDLKEYLDDSYIFNNNPVVLKDKNKKEIDYRDSEFTLTTKDIIQKLNTSNSKYVFKDANGGILNCSTLTRIFNEDWVYGGRLYRTDAQHIKQNGVGKSESRLGITINNLPVVEVDYCNLQAMLLCAIEGVHPDKWSGDFYQAILAGFTCKEKDRSLIKKSFSAMLNSETSAQAMKAIQGIINSNKSLYSFSSGYKVWQLIYNALPEFQKYFDTPDRIGLKLQRADSDMCLLVCNHFSDLSLPIIPIHDSFVVLDEHGDMLIQEMAKAFRRIVNVHETWPVFLRVESAYFPDELVVM